jgi:hypothetical protein
MPANKEGCLVYRHTRYLGIYPLLMVVVVPTMLGRMYVSTTSTSYGT